ncbi:MAG: EamA family transporter RarD [Treponema sp.]|jgi:chloramphenicol-sensitive protein RarD|nr:EamA family transporter RarD [Treponema sp.]
MEKSVKRGVCWTVLAYVLWGVLPLYWKLLEAVTPVHILSFRIIFSLVFTGTILLLRKNTAWLFFFTSGKNLALIFPAALAITANWGLFIWAVNTGRAIEASLGYFINPLMSIVMGLVFFRERLPPLQWTAFGFAAAGVSLMTVLSGTFPWISLALALTFGFYSLLKKRTPSSSLEGLGEETLAALPVAAILFLCPPRAMGDLAGLSPEMWALIVCAGPVTVFPLFCFAHGVKPLPLSAVGFIQFINPTLVFILGVFVFGERFPARNIAAFAFIWVSVILYSVSLLKSRRQIVNVRA